MTSSYNARCLQSLDIFAPVGRLLVLPSTSQSFIGGRHEAVFVISKPHFYVKETQLSVHTLD